MDFSANYTQIQDDSTVTRNGGLIIKGKARTERQPVHMILLVDSSGSMEEDNKMSSVKRSIQLLQVLLCSNDRLSVVSFADDSKVIVSRASATPEDRTAIQYRVDTIQPNGSTNLSAGLLEVRSLVEGPDSGRKQGVLILTDGHANAGVMTSKGLVEIVSRIQLESPGLSVTTVAYGDDHNTEVLTEIAKAGGGAYNLVRNLEDVATVFGDILGGLVSVSAQKVEVQLPPGAVANTQYRTTVDAGLTSVYVGDLYSEAEVTILFSSAPSFGAIRIKGTNMETLDVIDTVVESQLLTNMADIPISLLVADYRNKVSDVLLKLRLGGSKTQLKVTVNDLLTALAAEDRLRQHPLRSMLLEDLENAKNLLARGSSLTQNELTEVSQHSAYLGMARGLRTRTSAPHPPVVITSAPQDENAMVSPFANRHQSDFSQAMRSMTGVNNN